MGRRQKYTGEVLQDLIELSTEEFCAKYPNENRDNARALKSYHKRKKAKMERLPGHEDAPEGAEGWWQTALSNPNDPENPTIVTQYRGVTHDTDPEALAEVYEPATPARITPTKRKRAERLGKQILVFGDSQIGYHRVYDQEGNDSLIPTHSEEALSVLTQINAI